MNQQTTTRTNQLHDGFRRALDVLIAQAPGTQAEILHALSDASRSFAQQGHLQHITKSESRLAGHLMILGVGQLLTQAPRVEPLSDKPSRIAALVLEGTRNDGKQLITPRHAEQGLSDQSRLEQPQADQHQAKHPARQERGGASCPAHTAPHSRPANHRQADLQSALHNERLLASAQPAPLPPLGDHEAGLAAHQATPFESRLPSHQPDPS